MGIGQQPAPVQMEFPLGVYQGGVHPYPHNFRQKQVMAPQGQFLGYPAQQVYRAFPHAGAGQGLGRYRGQAA